MKIKRRIKEGNTYKEITEEVTLIEKRYKTVLVKLANGDILKRKLKDVIDLTNKE